MRRSSSVSGLRHLVHRLEGAQLFAKHEKLDQRVRRLLPAERRRVLGFGLALLAVAGETRRDALFDGFGVRGVAMQANARAELFYASVIPAVVVMRGAM